MNKKRRFLGILLVLAMMSGLLAMSAGEHTHSWSNWSELSPATCTSSGSSMRSCTKDGCSAVEYDYNRPAALGHDWGNWTVVTPATCIAEGQEKRECKRAGCTASETRTLSKLPHDMIPWHVTTPATCDNNGVEETSCRNCATQTQTRVITKLGHSYGQWNPLAGDVADCTHDGKEIRYCTRCGDPETRVVPKLGHQFGPWMGSPDPTCTAAGTRIKICARCAHMESEPVPMLEHQYGPWKGDPNPTCEAGGWRVRICAMCGGDDKEPLAALGHSYGAWKPEVDPSCTFAGSRQRTCTRCGNVDTQPVPALGPAQPAGHNNMGNWILTTPPTCTTFGEETRTCADCGRVEKRKVEKLPHTSDEIWVIVQVGDLRQPTKEATTCTVCHQPAKTKTYVPNGIRQEQRTFAYGPLAGQANPALGGSDVRAIWLDLITNATYTFPLVTPDSLNVGSAIVTVSNGTVRVSLEKNGETASLLRYRYWQAFSDAASISLNKLEGPSLPFDQAVPLQGDSAVIVVQMLANYYTFGVNTPFSDAETAWDGMSYQEINDEMLQNMASE